MTRPHLAPCVSCARHVRVTEDACPFCGAALAASLRESAPPRGPAVRLGRAALLAFSALGTTGTLSADASSMSTSRPTRDRATGLGPRQHLWVGVRRAREKPGDRAAGHRRAIANAYAERWVGTVRRDCLDWLLIVSRRQLERVLRVYVEHYNTHRPHRALGLKPPAPAPRLQLVGSNPPGQIQRRERLGRLINEYTRAA